MLRAKVLYGTNATKRPKFKRDMDFKRFDKLGLDNLYYEGFEVDLNELKDIAQKYIKEKIDEGQICLKNY